MSNWCRASRLTRWSGRPLLRLSSQMSSCFSAADVARRPRNHAYIPASICRMSSELVRSWTSNKMYSKTFENTEFSPTGRRRGKSREVLSTQGSPSADLGSHFRIVIVSRVERSMLTIASRMYSERPCLCPSGSRVAIGAVRKSAPGAAFGLTRERAWSNSTLNTFGRMSLSKCRCFFGHTQCPQGPTPSPSPSCAASAKAFCTISGRPDRAAGALS